MCLKPFEDGQATVVDTKLKELASEVKKMMAEKDVVMEVLVVKY